MTSPLIIPVEQLNQATLNNLVEEFVSRDGTDYGNREVSVNTRVQQVKSQLERGQALIVFDPDLESCTIMSVETWAELKKSESAATE